MYQLKKVYLEITNVCNLQLRLLSRHPPPPGLSVPGGLFCFSPKAAAPHGVSLSPSHGGAAPPPPAAKAVRHRRRAGLSGESHHQRHPAPPAGQFAVPEPGGAEGQRLPPLLRGERGPGPAAALSGRLHRLCPAGRQAGKRCALRLWNLDGETTQGANSCNDVILRRLEETFPRPWKEGWQGTTLAPRVYLEWGERFEWPDLERRRPGTVRLLPGPAGPRRRAVGRHGGPLLPGPRGGHPPGEPV